MKFSLNPSSGYTDSFFDIKFKLEFPKSSISEIRILNSKSNSYLDILSVDNGIILQNNKIVCKDCSEVSGFINIFNNDKNNKSMSKYPYVQLTAEISLDGNASTVKTTFYNESMSVDSQIIPMEVIINNNLDFSSQDDLLITVKSEKDKHFEFVIKDDKTEKKMHFEVITYDKNSIFKIPKEIIFHEFELEKFTISNLKLFWVKFEGVNFMKFLNKKLIEVPKGDIKISNRNFKLGKQTRNGPTGPLDDTFVISDRYFIHTHKNFSHFGAKINDSIKMKRLSSFFNESITMNKIDHDFHNFNNNIKKEIQETSVSIKSSNVKNFGFMKQKSFLTMYSNEEHTILSPVGNTTQSCKPCSRKK